MARRLILPLALLLAWASAGLAQEYISGDWTYTLNPSNEATITAYSGAGGAVVIPATIDGYAVKVVGQPKQAPDIPVTATIFDSPNTTVTSVTIPDSVTNIGHHAFYKCTGLTSIRVSPANPAYSSIDGVLFDKLQTTIIRFPEGRDGAYIIPDSVNSIGEGAFYDRPALTSVTIPDSVNSIGYGAFYDCPGLTSVTIPDSVTSVGGAAFYDCTGLTSVTIGSGVTAIGDRAFCHCTNLTSVTIPDSVTSIGNSAFSGCTSLTSVTIGSGVTSIGGNAFFGCAGLTSVTIPARFTDEVNDIFGSSSDPGFKLRLTKDSISGVLGFDLETGINFTFTK